MRLVSVRSRVRTSLGASVRVGVVGNISACHADAPGSIPGHGAFLRVAAAFFKNAAARSKFFFAGCGICLGAGCANAARSSRLAQLVERKTLNLVVVGSSPTVGVVFGACGLVFWWLNQTRTPPRFHEQPLRGIGAIGSARP